MRNFDSVGQYTEVLFSTVIGNVDSFKKCTIFVAVVTFLTVLFKISITFFWNGIQLKNGKFLVSCLHQMRKRLDKVLILWLRKQGRNQGLGVKALLITKNLNLNLSTFTKNIPIISKILGYAFSIKLSKA